MTARAQAAGIAAGHFSAEAVMEAVLAQVAAVNPGLNAVVSMREADTLLAEARAVDRADRAGGPLAGVPTAIKDLADVQGMPTSQGSPIYAGQMPEKDDPHVARMRAAGAIFIGKTNTPEFGLGGHTFNAVHGSTCNPYALDRSCGGSSGGAAVALSARMMSIADGSDMMGSLRNPAGWCNVYGMRPTKGLVAGAEGGDLYLHRLSTRGPMARCPDDLALLLDVMSDAASCEVLKPAGPGARIGWLGDWGGAYPTEAGVLACCEAALGVFEAQGATVTPLAPPMAREVLWEAWVVLRAFTLAAELQDLYADDAARACIKPDMIWEIEQGLALTAMDVHRASLRRSDWYRAAIALFERYDVLALPTAQLWPFDLTLDWPGEIAGQAMDTYHRWMEVTIPASLIGLPAVAVPAGFGAQGLPMGLQLIGAPGRDRAVLEVAEAYHRATNWPDKAPGDGIRVATR